MKKIILFSAIMATMFFGCADSTQNVKTTKKVTKSMPKMFQSVDVNQTIIMQQGKDMMRCYKCGMYLPKYFKTNHVANVDGVYHQYCSIHCLASEDHASDVRVVDTNSLKFIPANSAYYVIGSSKKGTMSPVSKYAFSTKKEAEEFAKKFGGKVGTFKDAFDMAQKDFTPEGKKWLEEMKAKKKKMMKMKKMMQQQ